MININSIKNFKDIEGNWSLPNSRSYLDIYSHEFKSMDLHKKLNNLGFLINEGMDFPEIIMRYCDNHSSYIVDAVKPTLLYYIQQMRWGEPIHATNKFFNDMTEVELAVLVQEEIRVRYSFGEVNCSHWDNSIFLEMTKFAKHDKVKFIEILRGTEFSKEFQNINRLWN